MAKINIFINNKFECSIPVEEGVSTKDVLDQVQDAFDAVWDKKRVSDDELVVSVPDYEVTYKAA